MAGFKVLETQFQIFIKSRIYLDDKYVVLTRNYFLQYTQLEIREFRDTLIQHMEYVKKSIDKRTLHKREYDSMVNERQMQTTEKKLDTSKALDASLVDTESSGTESKEQDTSSSSMYKEVSDRFVAPCFINGMEAYDGEINLGIEENMISNEYAVKLCLEYEVKRGNRVVKKELIVALRGEIYFVKFIINSEEDDVEPRMIFGRSFLRMTKAITDFEARTITIYPDIYPFLEEIKGEEKRNDDWDHLLDFNINDVPLLGEEGLSPFMCRMGKSSRNKKRTMENLNFSIKM
nr:hypothetical protein [Tanacetum cinerariifolium]